MAYLQAIFTTLRHIWIHRNRVLNDGLNPNPMTVILTSQSMARRYKKAFLDQPRHPSQPRRPNIDQYPPSGQWQLIVKIAGARSRKPKRWSFAYEAINMQGDSIFYGVISSVARTTCGTLLDAVVEAGIKARNHGFQCVLFLGASRQLVQVFRHKRTPDWLQQTRLADLNFLNQNGLCCNMFLVPHLTVKSVWTVAKLASQMPMNYCWYNPALFVSCLSPYFGIKKKRKEKDFTI